MAITKYLRFWKRPVARDVARLLSEVRAMRHEMAAMSVSLEQSHRHQAEALVALHDRVDDAGTQLNDVALAHLGVTDAMRADLDLRLEVIGDTALATLGEIAHLHVVQGDRDAGALPDAGNVVADVVADDVLSDMPLDNDDVLALPPRDRHAMLVLSSFFQHPVN